MKYFAYGTDLNEEDLRQRAGVRLAALGVACLPDHALRFRGGALDASPCTGHVVDGVLFEATGDDLKALDRAQDAGLSARPTPVLFNGAATETVTYLAAPGPGEAFREPAPPYLASLLEGFRVHGLARGPLLSAARGDRDGCLVDALFVYGTLMRNEDRHDCLGPLSCALLAHTWGRLVDLGPFPALLHGTARVHGEFVRLSEPGRTLRKLDAVEGFCGYGPASLYHRVITTVDVGDGRLRRAWVYAKPTPARGATVSSGCWRSHRLSREPFLRALARAHSHEGEDRLVRRVAQRMPYAFNPQAADTLKPLWAALERGEVSERLLAQESGLWTALTTGEGEGVHGGD